MNIPTHLENIINNAIHSIQDNPQGNLDYIYRFNIYPALNNSDSKTAASRSLGHRRRSILALLAMSHVLHIWETVWPNNYIPHHILYAIKLSLNNKLSSIDQINYEELLSNQDDIEVYTEESLLEWRARRVMQGAILTYDTVIHDKIIALDKFVKNKPDVASFALSVLLNNTQKQLPEDALISRDYWTWWLKEAVPAAWREEIPIIKPLE